MSEGWEVQVGVSWAAVAYREFLPSPDVEPFVECFWHLHSRGRASWAPIYPDGCCEIILNLADPADELRQGRVERQPRYFVYGQIDQQILIRSAADTEVLAIRLRPWGVRALLETPATHLTAGPIPLGSISPALAAQLIPIVEDGTPIAVKAARLEDCLGGWIRRRHREVPLTAEVARYLQKTPVSTVGDALQMTGWSLRTAQRRFRADVGLTLKRFLQVTRFIRFLRLLKLEPEATLSQLAVEAGYYDQSHLHRDLRRFTGATPARFRARGSATFDPLYGRERLARLVAL